MNKPWPGLTMTPRTIFGIGRNYAEHAKELGNAVPKAPVVFLKPVGCLSRDRIELPQGIGRVDHEVELVVAIGKAARNIDEKAALGCVAGYTVGIDVTARDVQEAAKKSGHPWAVAKGYATFAPLGAFVPPEEAGHGPFDLQLEINGEIRQRGTTKDMLFPVPFLVAYLSRIFGLEPGDLIFTGTPPGVGPLRAGDRCVARLSDRAKLEVVVA